MKVTAVLRTVRDLSRPVQFLGSDIESVSTMADAWLDAQGKPGDEFDVFVATETLAKVIPFSAATVLVPEIRTVGMSGPIVDGKPTHRSNGAPIKAAE